MDKLADFCIGLNLIAGLLALLVPLIEVFAMGRRAAGISSAILTGITLVSAVAAGVSMKAAAITDTGNSMLVVLPLTFLAILTCVVWVLVWLIPDALRSRARRD